MTAVDIDLSTSVVVPAHNNEEFIGECLDSIFNQSLQPAEIIICDDNSTDATRAIISEYESRFPERIRSVLHDASVGCAANFNSGIHAARSKYLAIVAADDYWLPRKLEYEMAQLSTSGFRWAYSAVELHWQDGPNAGRRAPFWGTRSGRSGSVFEDIVLRELSPRNFLVERGILLEAGGFDESFGMYEDWDLKLRLADKYPIAFVPEVAVVYRQHEQGISRASPERQLTEAGKVLRKNAELMLRHSPDSVHNLRDTAFRRLLPNAAADATGNSTKVPASLALPYAPRRLSRRGDGLVFFVGDSRSDMLSLLAQHPDLLCVEADCPAHQVLHEFASIAQDDASVFEAVTAFAHTYYRKRLWSSGRSRVLQPSPALQENLEYARKLFPAARILVDPVRHPGVDVDPQTRIDGMLVMQDWKTVFEFLDLPAWLPGNEPYSCNETAADEAARLIARGESRFADGNLAAAELLFRRALTVDASALDAYNNLAVMLWEKGDVGAALKSLGAGLAIEPRHRESLQNTIRILHATGELTDCRTLVDQYVAIYPDDDEMHIIRDSIPGTPC